MESMKEKWLIIAIIIVGIIFGIILGVYVHKQNDVSDINMLESQKLSETDNVENNQEYINSAVNEAVETSNVEEKISPNASIIQKRYYKGCDHLIRETIDIPEDLVNKTEEDVIKKYSDWKVEKYSSKEIVIYKEFSGICNEHYVVKEHNGIIGIYTENSEGVQELQEDTEISTQYLPEEDLENLKVGIKIVGKSNLYNFLEDYE